MLELIQAGGWLMIPIIACSIVALAIVCERMWVLRTRRVLPKQLVVQVWRWTQRERQDPDNIRRLRSGSPLGRILAAGLINVHHDREIMKESVEDTGRHVVHELERYLNALGTIAAISPLLGLLGTVIGMIKVFAAITAHGVGDPAVLAGGISEALLTTAAGLVVAIPTLVSYRYFRGRVQLLVIGMEQEAMKLVEVMQGERERDNNPEEGVE